MLASPSVCITSRSSARVQLAWMSRTAPYTNVLFAWCCVTQLGRTKCEHAGLLLALAQRQWSKYQPLVSAIIVTTVQLHLHTLVVWLIFWIRSLHIVQARGLCLSPRALQVLCQMAIIRHWHQALVAMTLVCSECQGGASTICISQRRMHVGH